MIPMAKNRHKKNKELDDQALESASGGSNGIQIDNNGISIDGHHVTGGLKSMNDTPTTIPGLGNMGLG